MADLISRAAARDVINTWGRHENENVRMDLLHNDLNAIPAVDAVPVVRCRDCKHWCRCDDGISGTCGALGGLWDENEFCSDGERRESE